MKIKVYRFHSGLSRIILYRTLRILAKGSPAYSFNKEKEIIHVGKTLQIVCLGETIPSGMPAGDRWRPRCEVEP